MALAARREPGSRSDARRNRAALVAAAREVFAEEGADARLEEIARRAAVGPGTLYRHFPTREALVEAIVEDRIDEFVDLGEAALATADAWDGLVGFLEATLDLRHGDRVLNDLLLRHPPDESRMAESRTRVRRMLGQVLERAQAQGRLRRDFTVADLTVLLWSFTPVIDATAATAPQVWRRHLHWLLDGLRPAAATAQTEPPLDEEQLNDAMRCLRARRFGGRRR